MVLVRDDVEPDVVAQQVLVQALLKELRGDFRLAVLVRQAPAHRVGARQHVLGHERVRVLAQVPGLHRQAPMKATTRSANASGCSISGWCPAASISSKRAPGIEAA